MKEQITIYCPSCGRKVAQTFEGVTMNINAMCNKCKRMVIYHGDTGKCTFGRKPERKTSSGVSCF